MNETPAELVVWFVVSSLITFGINYLIARAALDGVPALWRATFFTSLSTAACGSLVGARLAGWL